MEKKHAHAMYGLITAIAMIIIDLGLRLSGVIYNPHTQWVGAFSSVPFICGLIANAIAFSKSNDGYVTFGDVFVSCFKAVMVIALILIAWNVLSLFLFPDIKEHALETARQSMEDKHMPDDQMDKALEFTRKSYSTLLVGGIIFTTLFFGAIFSVIGAVAAKKKGRKPFFPGSNSGQTGNA